MDASAGINRINDLPMELLCNILWLAIPPRKPRRDLCRLSLVCRLWWEWIESSALFWTYVSAEDGPTYVRRALEKSKHAPIDLRHSGHRSPDMTLEALLVQAGPHIARWRPLIASLPSSPVSWKATLAALTTTPAPSLRTLNLRLGGLNLSISQDMPIILFGGAPASPSLKNITLTQIPVAFGPLRLSGLVSLALKHMATVSTLQLFEILRNSPGLKTLRLEGNEGLAAVEPRSSAVEPIELPKLSSLIIKWIDHGAVNCLLSTIRIPNRRQVSIRADVSNINARSVLFTPSIAHILHVQPAAITALDSEPWNIKVGVDDYCSTIEFRGLGLDFELTEEDQIQDILGWMAEGLGSEAPGCPVQLMLDWSTFDMARLAAVPAPLVVRHLSVSETVFSILPDSFHVALSRLLESTSSGWPLAQLESLSVRFDTVESQRELIALLQSRYGNTASASGTETRCPTNLRSVELRGRPRTEGLVEEIMGILGEANVFWA
ncbi:hypothetical protein FRC04_008087 [Tulasnella sp. 424]|nr:hypothetical protein FRC04_008087 [Tulasnella sp. 424]KAG8974744.1 hypothetical protein FRC05_006904 [Tulasnella sp. 425]